MTVVKFFSLFLLLIEMASAHVVLLDPGHGGEELGAIARMWKSGKKQKEMVNIYEKDLALELSKKVKKLLQKKHTVYLTRSFDRTLTLEERANMADTVKADIFVSIHFNSSTDNSHHGFETYYLDNHHDVAVKKVEQVENQYLAGAEKVINQILLDLVIEKTVTSSRKLASEIHQRIKSKVGKTFKLKDRGARPGLFYVLALSKRPGVLIEAGFMSNKSELKKLKSEKFLDRLAEAVTEGIISYLNSLPPKDLPLF